MKSSFALALALLLAAGCRGTEGDAVSGNEPEQLASDANLSLTRLDCGRADFKDMNAFFSDRPGVYPPGPGKAVDSCYLIRHGDQQMLWDTGFPAETIDKPMVEEDATFRIDRTLAEQLQQLGITPADVDILGISHMHGDHLGQAAQFTNARLVIGKRDFEMLAGKPEDTLGHWRASSTGSPAQPNLSLVSGDFDIFGDGTVMALHLPGHTPDHLALLVRLNSGPVLLTGDLYHTTISREKRSMPGFNTSREQTLQSMDRFEKLASELKAKVVIQHEPQDIAKLPTFPKAAE